MSNEIFKIIKLRKKITDTSEFGRQAAKIIDEIILERANAPVMRCGKWDESERDVLRKAHADFDRDHAVREASKHLNRTESQIRSMSKNMMLR